MKKLIVAIPIFIVFSFLGCSSANLKRESDYSAYLEFRVGFPVPEKEACDAFSKLKAFCPSGKYNIDLQSAEWGGQYYRIFKMDIVCEKMSGSEISKKEDKYFFKFLEDYNQTIECK